MPNTPTALTVDDFMGLSLDQIGTMLAAAQDAATRIAAAQETVLVDERHGRDFLNAIIELTPDTARERFVGKERTLAQTFVAEDGTTYSVHVTLTDIVATAAAKAANPRKVAAKPAAK